MPRNPEREACAPVSDVAWAVSVVTIEKDGLGTAILSCWEDGATEAQFEPGHRRVFAPHPNTLMMKNGIAAFELASAWPHFAPQGKAASRSMEVETDTGSNV